VLRIFLFVSLVLDATNRGAAYNEVSRNGQAHIAIARTNILIRKRVYLLKYVRPLTPHDNGHVNEVVAQGDVRQP